MTAPYSDTFKKKVLEYARDHGVAAAQKHYGLPHATITRWNQRLKIYVPQTAEYPLERRIEILKYAAEHGKRAAARRFNVSVGSIDLWDKKLKIVGARQKKFTDANKREILEFARDFGVLAAADKFDVLPSQIVDWNKTMRVYKSNTNYTDDEKVKILTYARDHGVTAAEQAFDVPQNTMQRWNRTLKIYKEREIPDYKKCSPEEQIQILRRAKEIYDAMPDGYQSAQQAFIVVAKEYGVTKDQLRKWNNKYKIVPLRPRAKRCIPQEIIDEAQAALDSKRGHVTAASRQSGISVNTITKLKKDKKIAFSRAKKNISTRPPVGKNKSKTIAAIIQALMQSKTSK